MSLTRVSRFATQRKSRCVLHYRPSVDPLVALTGQAGVFSRASAAWGFTSNFKFFTAAQHQPRIVRASTEAALLLEPQSTNIIQSFNLSSYTVSDTTLAAEPRYSSPIGQVPYRMRENTANSPHYMYASPTFSASSEHAFSVMVKAAGRTKGSFYLTMAANTAGVEFDLTAGTITSFNDGVGVLRDMVLEDVGDDWYRISCQGFLDAVSTTAALVLVLYNAAGVGSYAGDGDSGMLTTGWQHEATTFGIIPPTSYIETNGSAVTRSADTLYFPFNLTPQQPTTFYLRFRDRGGSIAPGSKRLLEVSDGTGSTPFFTIYHPGNGTVAAFFSDGVNVTQIGTDAYVNRMGDIVEVSVRLGHNGNESGTYGVCLQKSVAGGAVVTVGHAVTYLNHYAFPAAYAGQRLYLGSAGSGLHACAEFFALKVALGHHTLETMRDMF